MGDTWHLKRAEELLGHRDPGSVGSQFDVRVATAEALVQIAQELHDLNERMDLANRQRGQLIIKR